jgi:hypothetical protein
VSCDKDKKEANIIGVSLLVNSNGVLVLEQAGVPYESLKNIVLDTQDLQKVQEVYKVIEKHRAKLVRDLNSLVIF